MALGTGTIKLSEVKTEFGGVATPKLRDYLKGAGYVAAHENNANVVSSGTLYLGQGFRSNATFLVDKDFEGLSYTDGSVPFYGDSGPPDYVGYTEYWYGYYSVVNCGAAGTVNLIGESKSNTNQFQIAQVSDYIFQDSSTRCDFAVSGNHTNWDWTSITANGVTKTRASAFNTAGTYDSTNNITLWYWLFQTFSFDGSGSFDVRVVLP